MKAVKLYQNDGMLTAEDAVHRLLTHIGEDTSREGLSDTPKRVAKALLEMTEGYNMNPKEVLGTTFDAEGCDEMVILKGIDFTSLCEHHMLRFVGTAVVGYIPTARIVGISKLARLVDCFSKRLQNQERLTAQVVSSLMVHLDPLGAACVIQAHHQCMGCRGVKRGTATMVTSSLAGQIRTDPTARAEFMALATQ
jgi:GTP cyclohydrolase I